MKGVIVTKVEIANGWTDPQGEFHKAGTVIEVEPGVARDLISRGKARLPESESEGAEPEDPKPEALESEVQKPEALEPEDPKPAAESKPKALKPATAAKEAGKNG